MLDILTGIFIAFLMLLIAGMIGWMAIDMLCPNLFRGIKIKFTVKGVIDFIKAVYNMEVRK